MSALVARAFRLVDDAEPTRVIRGRVLRIASAPERQPCVLLLHGFKGFMDWGFFPVLARRLAHAGFTVVAFNASGSGIGDDLENFTELEAFARDSYSRQLEDIERVRAHLATCADIDGARLGLFGHSRGGGIGLIHAAERGDYGALVTWAAIDDADRFDAPTKELWRRAGRIFVRNERTQQDLPLDVGALEDFERRRERFDILRACARISAPTLLLHGALDLTVDPTALERFARAFPAGAARTQLVAGATHAFGANHPLASIAPELELALDDTTRWFREHLIG